MKKNVALVDLFAGTGAFSQAFKASNHNIHCVFANDYSVASKAMYEANHPNTEFRLEDLNQIDVQEIPPHDVLCGGFPCQPFSIAGKRQGFDDKRSNVFWKIIEILKHHKPKLVLLENVKNLTTHNKGDTFKVIQEELKNAGYFVKWKVLDTSTLTKIPQHRERIYLVCFRNSQMCEAFNFDFCLPTVEEKLQIKDLLESSIDPKYYYTKKLKVYDMVSRGVTKHIDSNTVYQYRRVFVRENKTHRCPTLTANMGGGGHNVPLIRDDNGVRKLTPRECFNLQGFPKQYTLPDHLSNSKLYTLAGNAVSLPVVELIVAKLDDIGLWESTM